MENEVQLDMNRIPKHVAIIMDGNGRWARQRGLDRSMGHQAGAETVHLIANEANRLGIRYLTLYTFSTENWSRPETEVAGLMGLLFEHIEEETFMKNNIRFQVIGDIERLPEFVRVKLQQSIVHTAKNTGMHLVLALSYSSKWELAEAAKRIAQEVKDGQLDVADIDSETVRNHLTTRDMPDVDLLIRTGGEQRLSNYLLWQSAYAELYFCHTFWPDFKERELQLAIADYQTRERRYGKTSEQVQDQK